PVAGSPASRTGVLPGSRSVASWASWAISRSTGLTFTSGGHVELPRGGRRLEHLHHHGAVQAAELDGSRHVAGARGEVAEALGAGVRGVLGVEPVTDPLL